MRAGLKTTILIAMLTAFASVAFAVPDGLGTNHVQNLRVHQRLDLGGVAITNWQEVAESTLTTDSIETDMIQDDAITTDKIADGAVTEDELAGSVAGDGLTGGDGTPLSVDLVPDGGLGFTLEQLGVDATVIRATGDQTITGDTTLLGDTILDGDTTLQGGSIVITNATLTIPEPSDPSHAATQRYVDDKLSSSVADGGANNETLRWDDTAQAWTNNANFTADAAGNLTAAGTLDVTGATTLSSTLGVTGDTTVGGTLGVTGVTTVTDINATGNADVTGTLGVTGAATLSDTLDVTGATTLGALNVTGAMDFTGATATTDLNMNDNRITGLAAPSDATDAATKRYVDHAINGLSWKQAVRVSPAGNIARDQNYAATPIDGVSLSAGDRVLLRAQTTDTQNGIHIVSSDNGHLVRAPDMTNTTQLAGAAVFVAEGTSAGTAWVVTTPEATVGDQTIDFVQFASPGTYEAGTALTLDGLTFNVDVAALAGAGLQMDNNQLRLAPATGLGLTGGGGDPLAVDSSVVRTSDDFTLAGNIAFTAPVAVAEPTDDGHAVNRGWVQERLSSSVASGTADDQTLRWDDTAQAWTNNANFTVNEDGNVDAGGTLGVAGATTLDDTLTVTGLTTVSNITATGDANIAGTLDVTDEVNLASDLTVVGDATIEGDLNVEGDTTLQGQFVVEPGTTAAAPLQVSTTEITDITRSYVFIRGDGSAQTVTSIAAGTAGQMITFQGANGSTPVTLTAGGNLQLNSGINFTLQTGNIIQFIWDGTNWRETFRTAHAAL